MKYSEELCIISGPSGTGKSTLIQTLINSNFGVSKIKLSISYTTRTQRPEEQHGKDYYFISIKEFQRMIYADLFFEYAKVFNNYYGTSKNDIKLMLDAGIHIILDVDWNGAQQICSKVKDAYTIFILPPSKKELKRRLYMRAQGTETDISFRMKKSMDTISHVMEYDYIIVNDNFDIAFMYLKSIILSKQLQLSKQKIYYKTLIKKLMMSDR